MKQIFGCLSEVYLAMNGLRPMLEVTPGDESFDDKMAQLLGRLGKMQAAYNKLLVESETKLPFYPAELQSEVEKCMLVASLEINSIRTAGHSSFSDEWYENGQRNRGRFDAEYRKAADIIRARISELAILPGG
jgi:hypothetical protein